MSNTKNMIRQHSEYFKRKHGVAIETGITASTDAKSQPPPGYHDGFTRSFTSLTGDQLPAYTSHPSDPAPAPPKTFRKGHRLGDFFGAAFTGYIPKERAPAFELFEPRRTDRMGSMPGAVEARRCTGGMTSSGRKDGKEEKEEEKKKKKMERQRRATVTGATGDMGRG